MLKGLLVPVMDAVELPLPVDVAAPPKLMGSEGFVRARVTVKEMEGRGSDRVSIFVSRSIECCNSPHSEDVANLKKDKELPSQENFQETELCNNSSQLHHIQNEEISKNVHGKGRNGPTSRLVGVPSQIKAGKLNRNYRSSSKRIRMSQSEDSSSLNGIENSKDISDKSGSQYIKCSSLEKSHLPKQKSWAIKRGDRRNFKVSAKAKFDSSSMKLGAGIFSSSCGGNNFFGLYGLKHDIRDVTKLVNEPTLDELLGGTFDCPSLSKDKGKKASNMNESLLDLVRKACSILQLPKCVQSQNVADTDSPSNRKMSACRLNSFSVVESGGNADTSQPCTIDVSCQKDSCGETATLASPFDFPLYQPKDVLERIALPPSWDLESLFMEASKPAVTSKSINDIRLGNQISRHPSLPAFPWSHAFGGHCRTNSDAVKLSTNRSTCQGKWARIGVIGSSTGIDHGCFTNLDSYGYDQSLVPSAGSSDDKVFPSLCASLPFCQWDCASLATCSKASQVSGDAEFEDRLDNTKTVTDAHCPRLLAAAQTLYDIATHLPRQNPGGIVRWQKKISYKSMKARNLKSNDKTDETLSTPISVIGSDHMVGSLTPSKKPRLSIVDRKDSAHSNNVKKGPIAWPTSKSSRSLSNKSVRDPVVENRHSTESILKQHSHSMMPPPSRVGDKPCDSQQKARKLVLMDWKRGRVKSD